jgi:hypothetical protein
MARIMYGITLGIDDIADITHFGIGKLQTHYRLLDI